MDWNYVLDLDLEMIEVAIYLNELMVVTMHICTHIYLHPCISSI